VRSFFIRPFPFPVRPDDHRLKIDSAIALILALSRAIVACGPGSVYDNPDEPVWIGADDNET
jgi:hypothetical protein